MSISIERTLPQDEWRRFVDEHPAGNIFHTPEMFQVFSRTQGFRPELWAAIENRRTLALLLPVQIALRDHWLRRFTSRAVTYGSVLCAPTVEGKKALAMLLHHYIPDVHIISTDIDPPIVTVAIGFFALLPDERLQVAAGSCAMYFLCNLFDGEDVLIVAQ